jgi:steroid delta-isomerase-like uncharacterized protein
MSTKENEANLRRAIDAWNQGNLDAYLQLYHPDVVLHGYAGVEPGLDSVRQFYTGFFMAFPGSRLTIEDVVTEDDKVVCRFSLTATHQGNFMGIPPTGKEVGFAGITILQFKAGKCMERWSQADFLSLLQQLGAIPAPA